MSQSAFSPLVSVIIPAYNAQATLGDTLRSAIANTYNNVELIVVDDGSTDATLSVAEELAAQDPRIRVVERVNGGLAAALNSGFAIAKGDYFARLDADDLWHPSKLEAQVDFASTHPDVAFIYTFARYVDGDDRVIRDGPQQAFPRWAHCRGLYESLVGGGSSALMKRSAVEEADGCDESFRNWEDLLLQLAISARHPIGVVPQYLVGYRLRPGSLTKDIGNMLRGWRALRRKLRSQPSGVPSFVHAWAHGVRCMMFAEGFAWDGQYLQSATLLLQALRHDPAWTLKFIRYRLARRASKASRAAGEPTPKRNFFDCDPADSITPPDWFEGHPAERQFAKFEENRVELLRKLDQHLAISRVSGLKVG